MTEFALTLVMAIANEVYSISYKYFKYYELIYCSELILCLISILNAKPIIEF